MRKIDLNLGRKKLAEVDIDKRKVFVYQPVLRQLLEHENMRAEMLAEATSAREKGDFVTAAKVQMEFLVSEILIFVPDLKREDVLEMTEEQRLAIMRVVRPELYVEEGSENKDPQKNNK